MTSTDLGMFQFLGVNGETDKRVSLLTKADTQF
jgi:hypothetical protein